MWTGCKCDMVVQGLFFDFDGARPDKLRTATLDTGDKDLGAELPGPARGGVPTIGASLSVPKLQMAQVATYELTRCKP